MDHFSVLGAVGIRVIEVPDLGRDCLFARRYALLLADAGLTDGDRETVACRTLGAAVHDLARRD